MNKAELRASVQRSLDCTAAEAEKAVQAVFSAVAEGLQKDTSVQIMGFGTFQLKPRAARVVRNPSTGQPMQVPASHSILATLSQSNPTSSRSTPADPANTA